MQGSVRKRGSSWYYRYYEDGKQIERKGGNTKKEAQQKLNEELNRQYKGFSKPEEMYLKSYLDMWLQDYIKDLKSENTYLRYKNCIDKHIVPALGNIRLCELKVIHIEKFLKGLRNTKSTNSKLNTNKLSSTSIQFYYGVLNNSLNRAVKLQMIYDNPCKYIDPPKRTKFKATPLTLEEFKLIYSDLDSNNYEDYILKLALDLTLETGLRRGEMCGLTWSNINISNSSITIDKALIREDNKYCISGTKTDSSEREIPISSQLLNLLLSHKNIQNENKLKYDSFYKNNIWNGIEYDLVFTWKDGSYVKPATFLQRMKRLCKKHNIDKNVRWHDLRHTNATLLLESGVNMKVVQERLGHSIMQTTSDIYSHVTKKMNRDATNLITSLINKGNVRED